MSCPTHHPELGNSFESDGHLVNLSSRWLFFDRFLLKNISLICFPVNMVIFVLRVNKYGQS